MSHGLGEDVRIVTVTPRSHTCGMRTRCLMDRQRGAATRLLLLSVGVKRLWPSGSGSGSMEH